MGNETNVPNLMGTTDTTVPFDYGESIPQAYNLRYLRKILSISSANFNAFLSVTFPLSIIIQLGKDLRKNSMSAEDSLVDKRLRTERWLNLENRSKALEST
jgi:hypothetical protein